MIQRGLQREELETRRGILLFITCLIVLLASIVFYLWLHWTIPNTGPRLAETEARDAALTAIAQAAGALTETVGVGQAAAILTQTMTTISTTVASAHGVTATIFLGPLADAQTQELARLARDSRTSRLQALFPGLAESVRGATAFNAAPEISATLKLFDEETKQSEPDVPKLQLLLTQLERAVKDPGDRYFWSIGFGKWAEFLFWGWFGSLFFVLMEIRKWFPLDVPNRRYRDFTPWYIEVALRGPIVSLLIMFFISNVEVSGFGITLTLKNTAAELQIFIAGVLGYYSRIAKTQLDLIVEKIFPDAWKRSTTPAGAMTVQPSDLFLELGASKQLQVTPPQDVIWSLSPPDLGQLTEGGLYTAPTQEDAAGKTATIKAVSAVDANRSAKTTVVILKKFAITPAQASVKFGGTQAFSTGGIVETQWTIEPKDIGEIDGGGTYTAPAQGKLKDPTTVTVIARMKSDPTREEKATITLSNKLP